MLDSKVIVNHILVPKHEIMSKKESKAFLESNGLKKDQLPRILREDPVVKAIKAKKGDIIKITRNSPTAGKAVYYRMVY
ncbi:MAG: DNA-directed RNA polymerase subunit H [Candidatus Diapherotrites archaeon]|nr:DNA-directed RNA polymerase subunit H [Candidatus Diapherotrites archaeon]